MSGGVGRASGVNVALTAYDMLYYTYNHTNIRNKDIEKKMQKCYIYKHDLSVIPVLLKCLTQIYM